MQNALSERHHRMSQRLVKADTTYNLDRTRLKLISRVSLVLFLSSMANVQAVSLEFDWHLGELSQKELGTHGERGSDPWLTAILNEDYPT
jgi:hypothetical protein